MTDTNRPTLTEVEAHAYAYVQAAATNAHDGDPLTLRQPDAAALLALLDDAITYRQKSAAFAGIAPGLSALSAWAARTRNAAGDDAPAPTLADAHRVVEDEVVHAAIDLD